MKYVLLTLIIIPIMACASVKNTLAGKTFRHTYLFSTSMNEFGKGGGKCYLSLSFQEDKVIFCDICEETAATESGKYETSRDTISTLTASYRFSANLVVIDSRIIPEVKVEGDTLVAPQIAIDSPDAKPELFNNAKFTLQKQQ